MPTLTPSERRALRARAHPLRPVVTIGQHGLTPAVAHEIDVALLAHELIKIRVFSGSRDDRDALLLRVCVETDAAPVQHLGKVLTVWRPKPAPEPTAQFAKPPRPARRPRQASAAVDPAAARPGAAKPPASRVTGAAAGRRDRDAKPHGKATASRRRPSDVTSTGTNTKRRAVKGGMGPEARKRAPATTKGPFQPGKRTARPESSASTGGEDRSHRRPAAGGKAPTGVGTAGRRPAAAGRAPPGVGTTGHRPAAGGRAPPGVGTAGRHPAAGGKPAPGVGAARRRPAADAPRAAPAPAPATRRRRHQP